MATGLNPWERAPTAEAALTLPTTLPTTPWINSRWQHALLDVAFRSFEHFSIPPCRQVARFPLRRASRGLRGAQDLPVLCEADELPIPHSCASEGPLELWPPLPTRLACFHGLILRFPSPVADDQDHG